MNLNYPDSNLSAELIQQDVQVSLMVLRQGEDEITMTRQDCWDLMIRFLSVTDQNRARVPGISFGKKQFAENFEQPNG